MGIESILIGFLRSEGVLFEKVKGFCFIMFDDVPHWELFH